MTVAAELLLDLGGGLVERGMRLLARARGLEHDALHHVGDDVAAKGAVRGGPEGHIGRDGPREIFLGDATQSIGHMLTESVAGVDLMAGYADVHVSISYLVCGRAG